MQLHEQESRRCGGGMTNTRSIFYAQSKSHKTHYADTDFPEYYLVSSGRDEAERKQISSSNDSKV